jgi:hypothetical protein
MVPTVIKARRIEPAEERVFAAPIHLWESIFALLLRSQRKVFRELGFPTRKCHCEAACAWAEHLSVGCVLLLTQDDHHKLSWLRPSESGKGRAMNTSRSLAALLAAHFCCAPTSEAMDPDFQ